MGNQQAVGAGDGQSTMLSDEEIREATSHFVETYPSGYITRSEFIRDNQMQFGGEEDFWKRLFDSICGENQTKLELKDFLVTLYMHLRAPLEEKIRFAFQCNDLDSNGYLEQNEILSIVKALWKTTHYNEEVKAQQTPNLKKILENPNEEEAAKQLLALLDKTGDGRVSEEEFVSACLENENVISLFSLSVTAFASITVGEGHDFRTLELEEFSSQVAGHKGKLQMLKSKDGKIWKPYNPTEFEFYESLGTLPSNTYLRKMVTEYYGRHYILHEGVKTQYIVLRDLTRHMRRPCILDLKIGTQGYGVDATPGKVIQQVALCSATTSRKLGFRMCGMRVWQDGAYVIKDKPWGATISGKESMSRAIKLYLDNGNGPRFDLIKYFLPVLHNLLSWFKEQALFRFYSSSLLFIYEGDPEPGLEENKRMGSRKDTKRDSGSDEEEGGGQGSSNDSQPQHLSLRASAILTESHVSSGRPIVKMIDFAHAHPIPDSPPGSPPLRDESYITGLSELIQILEAIQLQGINIIGVPSSFKEGDTTHDMVKTSFLSPTFCNWCKDFVWGLPPLQLGFRCSQCDYCCHTRCYSEMSGTSGMLCTPRPRTRLAAISIPTPFSNSGSTGSGGPSRSLLSLRRTFTPDKRTTPSVSNRNSEPAPPTLFSSNASAASRDTASLPPEKV